MKMASNPPKNKVALGTGMQSAALSHVAHTVTILMDCFSVRAYRDQLTQEHDHFALITLQCHFSPNLTLTQTALFFYLLFFVVVCLFSFLSERTCLDGLH